MSQEPEKHHILRVSVDITLYDMLTNANRYHNLDSLEDAINFDTTMCEFIFTEHLTLEECTYCYANMVDSEFSIQKVTYIFEIDFIDQRSKYLFKLRNSCNEAVTFL